MSVTDGHQALIRRLVTMTTTASIALPNAPGAPGVPRYVVQEAGGGQNTYTLDGDTNARPEIVVRCEVEADTDAAAANALAKALVDRFAVGSKFDGLTVLQAPNVRPPIVADGIYAIPVVIRGFMTF